MDWILTLMFGFPEMRSKRVLTVRWSKKTFLPRRLRSSDAFLIVFPITMQAFQLTLGLLLRRELKTTCLIWPLMVDSSSKIVGKSTCSRKEPRARRAFAATLNRSDLANVIITVKSCLFRSWSRFSGATLRLKLLSSVVACEARTATCRFVSFALSKTNLNVALTKSGAVSVIQGFTKNWLQT